MKEKQNQSQMQETPQTVEGDNQAKPAFSWRKLMGKKWAYPAIYMAAAAIILTLMWMYQGSADLGGKKLSDTEGQTAGKTGTEASQTAKPGDIPVGVVAREDLQWPVKDRTELDVSLPYYNEKGTNEAKQLAMIEYDNTFQPHMGVDLAREDSGAFEVVAAMNGKVTAVENNPVAGTLVEITHPNGLVTVYQSLADVKVTKGAEVKKGEVIAKAGRNELEKDEGVHLHFEIRHGEDGTTFNPADLLPK